MKKDPDKYADLRKKMMRGVSRDVYAKLPIDSLLWNVFHAKSQEHSISFGQLKKLKEELNDLIDDLWEQQTVDDDDEFTLDINIYEDDLEISVIVRHPETIGQWKSRLSKMQKDNHFDPVAVEMIKKLKESLFDLTQRDKVDLRVNPNNITSY